VVGVRIGEKQVQLALPELPIDARQLLVELLCELWIVVGQRLQLDQVGGPLLQALPGSDLFSQLGRLPAVAPRLARVVPDPGLG